MITENTNEPTVETPKRGRPSKTAEEVPVIDNAVISQLLDRMKRIEDENKMLKDIAGNAAIADYAEANKDRTQKLAHFKVNDGKIIIGWKCTKNEVKKVNGTYVEDIRTEVEYMDGSKEELDYTDFIRCHTITKAKILSIDHKTGMSTLLFPTGETKTISTKFLNA